MPFTIGDIAFYPKLVNNIDIDYKLMQISVFCDESNRPYVVGFDDRDEMQEDYDHAIEYVRSITGRI